MVLTSDGLTNSGAALTEASSPHPPNPGCLARPVGVSEYVYIQSPALFRNVLRIPDASAVGAKKLCQQTRQTHLPCQLPPEAEWPQQHMTSRPRDSDLRGRGGGGMPCVYLSLPRTWTPPLILPSPTQAGTSPSSPSSTWSFPSAPLHLPSHLHVHSHLLQTSLQTALCLEPSPGTHCLQDASQLLLFTCKALCDLPPASSASVSFFFFKLAYLFF